LRRILRRSTITSESSDIDYSPGNGLASHGVLRAALRCRATITSIATQYEENKA
jgi:hypothetical protein